MKHIFVAIILGAMIFAASNANANPQEWKESGCADYVPYPDYMRWGGCIPVPDPAPPSDKGYRDWDEDWRSTNDAPVINFISPSRVITSCVDQTISFGITTDHGIKYIRIRAKGPWSFKGGWGIVPITSGQTSATWTPLKYGCDPLKPYIYQVMVEVFDDRGHWSLIRRRVVATP